MTSEASRDDLQFFGRVSASISHEIKNVLAVINEGAGLLDDLSLMAEKGMPLDPARLATVSKSILGQVQRGDAIIKNMNTFAHSVDEPVGSVELPETVSLVQRLSARLAAGKSMKVELGTMDDVRVTTDPYSLEHLIFSMVDMALARADGGEVLELSAVATSDGAEITLAAMDFGTEIPKSMARIADMLGAEIATDTETGTLRLTLPQAMPEENR